MGFGMTMLSIAILTLLMTILGLLVFPPLIIASTIVGGIAFAVVLWSWIQFKRTTAATYRFAKERAEIHLDQLERGAITINDLADRGVNKGITTTQNVIDGSIQAGQWTLSFLWAWATYPFRRIR